MIRDEASPAVLTCVGLEIGAEAPRLTLLPVFAARASSGDRNGPRTMEKGRDAGMCTGEH